MQEYAQLASRLPEVEAMGYVRTHRSGDTGVGKTLEDILGIEENNFAGPNGHMTEIKAARRRASGMLTLFTKTPLPPGINSQLLEKFGRTGGRGKPVLHTTINAVSRNTLYGRPGFRVDVRTDAPPPHAGRGGPPPPRARTRIVLSHAGYGDLPEPYWNKEDLERAFRKKYPENLLYVKADHRGRGAREEFHYNEAWLMSGFGFDRFLELLRSRLIVVDIRLGRRPDGSLHDHGTGFRIRPGDLVQCFAARERVL